MKGKPVSNDPLADLLHTAKVRMAGFTEVLHPETGELLAVFPRVKPHASRALQDVWEERAIAMHLAQSVIDPDSLPQKIEENPMQAAERASGLIRGD